VEKFRAIEAQAILIEKQEVLEVENLNEMRQGTNITRTEANSKLIGQVMLFDPNGPPRRPPPDVVQSIKKLNSDYKLGQMLCKSRQPDFLLAIIKRQNAKLSLPWLSSMIESSSGDSLEILPIQCICEYVWNLSNGGEAEELPTKKQLGLDNLLNLMKQILNTRDLND
jgi:integrator complex subunit 1